MPIAAKKPTIVIEARGGTVVALYGDNNVAEVVLVDWDEYCDDDRPGVMYDMDPLSKMPPETRLLVHRGLLVANRASNERSNETANGF